MISSLHDVTDLMTYTVSGGSQARCSKMCTALVLISVLHMQVPRSHVVRGIVAATGCCSRIHPEHAPRAPQGIQKKA